MERMSINYYLHVYLEDGAVPDNAAVALSGLGKHLLTLAGPLLDQLLVVYSYKVEEYGSPLIELSGPDRKCVQLCVHLSAEYKKLSQAVPLINLFELLFGQLLARPKKYEHYSEYHLDQ